MLLNTSRLQQALQREGIDALVATSPENVTYTSGFYAMSQWIRRGPQAYVLTPREDCGEPAIVASTGALDLIADQGVRIRDVRRYGHFSVQRDARAGDDACGRRLLELLDREDCGDPVRALIAAIEDRGLATATLGIDEGGILPQHFDALREALPKATIRRAANVFRHVRAVKTPDEIERLKRSARIAELSIESALAIARPSVTERELAHAFHQRTIVEGAMPVLGVICSGPRSAFSSGQPGERRLVPGDIIRFDVGGRFEHYRADISRCAVLGQPTPKQRQYHAAIRAGLLHAHAVIRPGLPTADVFTQVVAVVRRSGIPHYERNHVGHGIGLDGYDAPNITPGSDEVFEEGMTLSVETPYYELGWGGLQVEDTMVVTRDGVETFMQSSSELRIV